MDHFNQCAADSSQRRPAFFHCEPLEARRLMAAGDLDTTFSDDGRLYDPSATAVALAVQNDGLYLTAGEAMSPSGKSLDFGLERHKPSGLLDREFDGDGRLTVSPLARLGYTTEEPFLKAGDESARFVAVREDGKILVGGSGNTFLEPRNTATQRTASFIIQLNPDGSIDASYGQNGVAVVTPFNSDPLNNSLEAMKLDDQGRVVYVGVADGATYVARLTPAGLPDQTFNNGAGRTAVNLTIPRGSNFGGAALGLQSTGKIILSGISDRDYSAFALIRLNTDGTPDTQFGESGLALTPFGPELGLVGPFGPASPSPTTLAIGPDDRIWVAGTLSSTTKFISWGLSRLLADGTQDRTFLLNGVGYVDFIGGPEVSAPSDISIQPDGKAVVAGFVSNTTEFHMTVARLRADDGELDETFGRGEGFKYIDFPEATRPAAYAMAVLPDGNILAAGTSGGRFETNHTGTFLAQLQGDAGPNVVGLWASGSTWSDEFFERIQMDGVGSSYFGYRLGAGSNPSLPWMNIDTLIIQLDSAAAASVTAAGVSVRMGFDPLPLQSVSVAPTDDRVVVVRLAAPLRVGEAHVQISGARDANGDFLDPTIPILPGDVNQSGGAVDASDMTSVRNNVGRRAASFKPYDVRCDLNGDGVVNAADLVGIRTLVGVVLPASPLFDFADFRDATRLQFFGAARKVRDLIGLVPAAENQKGAVRLGGVRSLAEGFSTSFKFRYTNIGGRPDLNGNPGTDGLAFTIQPPGSAAPTVAGAGLSVWFDAFRSDVSDISSSRVGVYVDGESIAQFDAEALGLNFRSGNAFTARIDYDGSSLRIRLNGQSLGNVPIHLGSVGLFGLAGFNVDGYADQRLLNWSARPATAPPALRATPTRFTFATPPQTLESTEKRRERNDLTLTT